MNAEPTDAVQTPARSDAGGLSLAPFHALRPHVPDARLGNLLCPPYDVIDASLRESLLSRDPANAVAVILPQPDAAGYADAAARLDALVAEGVLVVDAEAALYVYEMREATGNVTRGLLGAVELRAPEDGVILPHESTMAGPVADRLAVMTATGADLEPIYLVYDGGGAASASVRSVDENAPIAAATTPDGITHRLWALTDRATIEAVTADLRDRHALIADGHHRYATYRERQRTTDGDTAADRGLALLVDTSEYGPQVHAIHRVLHTVDLDTALGSLGTSVTVTGADDAADALAALPAGGHFAAVLTDGDRTVVVTDAHSTLAEAAHRPQDLVALAELDVTVLHRGLVENVLGLNDSVDTVDYAHSVAEAVESARNAGGVAVLLRPTPVDAVAAVAAAGGRMPRKSTLFTPKPASGLVIRRLRDQHADASPQ